MLIETPIWRRCLAALAISLSYGMFTPLVGSLTTSGQNALLTGVLIGLYPLAKAVGYASCLFPAVMRWKPSWLLVIGAISYVVLGLSLHPIAVASSRIVEGFVFGLIIAQSSIVIAQRSKARGESLSWLNAMSSAGVFIGPLLIVIANALGRPQSAFYIVAVLCIIAAIATVSEVQHTPASANVESELNLKRHTLYIPWNIVFLFAVFDLTYGAISIAVPIAFKAFQGGGMTETALLLASGFMIFSVAMPMFGRLADRFGANKILLVSCATIIVLFLTIGSLELSPNVIALLLGLEFIAASAAYASALAMMGSIAPRGLAVAGVVQSIGMAAGSAMAGQLLVTGSYARVFIGLSIVYAVSVAAILFNTKRNSLRLN